MTSGKKRLGKKKSRKKKKKKAGSPWRDSNSRPLVYKTSALTTELQRRRVVMMPSITVLLAYVCITARRLRFMLQGCERLGMSLLDLASYVYY